MPATGRRLGLSKYGKAPSLLKSLNRPGSNGHFSASPGNGTQDIAQSSTNRLSREQRQEKDDIYGPPIDSDDEEEGIIRRTNQSSDEEEEEEAGRGDILPTVFKARGTTRDESMRDAVGDSDDIDGFSPIREHLPATSHGNRAKSPSLRRSRRNGSESANNTPKKARTETSPVYKLKEVDIFSTAPSIKPRTKTFKRYGSQTKSQGSRSSQSNGETSPQAVFKKPPKLEFELPVSPLKTFKMPGQVMPDELEVEARKTLKVFSLPSHNLDSSTHEKTQLELEIDVDGLSPLEFDAPSFRSGDFMNALKWTGAIIDRTPFQALENGEGAPSQVRVFQMPLLPPPSATCDQVEANGVSSPQAGSFEMAPLSPEYVSEAACPMCGESVDALFLRRYNGGKRMNIRTQTKFCRSHKKRSATNEWVEKGYPTIDWINLDSRFAQHHSYLKSILDGATSFYRNILAEQVKSGKDRTLLQAVKNSENTLIPGYYGPRGFRAMSENIMDAFASQLRRIAVTDRLVAARGVTGYVQFVLVPELTVRLICEDMSLEVDEARQVMQESAVLGDLLNEEVEDIVTWKEGDETL